MQVPPPLHTFALYVQELQTRVRASLLSIVHFTVHFAVYMKCCTTSHAQGQQSCMYKNYFELKASVLKLFLCKNEVYFLPLWYNNVVRSKIRSSELRIWIQEAYKLRIHRILTRYTDKKEIKMFLIYKEIQKGAVAKSYMTNGLLIYGEISAHFLIY